MSDGGGYSAKGVPPAVEVIEIEAEAKGRSSRVSFGAGAEEKSGNDWGRAGGPTPHPKKIPNELFFDEDGAEVSVAEAPAPAAAPPTEAPVEVPVEPAAEVSTPAAPAEAPAVDVPATVTPVAQISAYESSTVETPAVDAPAGATASATPAAEDAPAAAQKIGVTGSPSAGAVGKADDTFEESYEEDFADDTQNSMSKALASGAEDSGTFEDSQG